MYADLTGTRRGEKCERVFLFFKFIESSPTADFVTDEREEGLKIAQNYEVLLQFV